MHACRVLRKASVGINKIQRNLLPPLPATRLQGVTPHAAMPNHGCVFHGNTVKMLAQCFTRMHENIHASIQGDRLTGVW